MSKNLVTTCDGLLCSHVKGETNHWLVGAISGEGVILLGFRKSSIDLLLGDVNDSEISDFCGVECAMKWISITVSEIQSEKETKSQS